MDWVHPPQKGPPMSKLLAAVRRTFSTPYTEPEVHFHQGQTEDFPEVCYDGDCRRPQLSA